ncbi:DnaJ domain-containing protein [Dioscorea alata]|uniref:DnaJ domain-containing protein n=1 Tax=Dioscorea alata TaxID=55571 RepID=A0ACB7V6D0_DIOAL|nr:DnaJ domain-containing protein [Dioscorea alata]
MISTFSLSSQFLAPRIADSRRASLPRSPRSQISASCAAAPERPPPIRASTVPSGSSTLYDVLGIGSGASAPEIKAAYRRLARACHPDVVKGSSADEFLRIHAAYTTLSDPTKRADYDRSLAAPDRLRHASFSPFYGYTRRSWETDQCW